MIAFGRDMGPLVRVAITFFLCGAGLYLPAIVYLLCLILYELERIRKTLTK